MVLMSTPGFLQALVSEEHFASSEITSRLLTLEEEHKNLWMTWEKRQHLFKQCKELQVNFHNVPLETMKTVCKYGLICIL